MILSVCLIKNSKFKVKGVLMGVCKIVFSLLFIASLTQSVLAKDWSKVICPSNKEAYIDEAIKLIASGYLSNKESVCLKNEDFKYFNVEGSDIGDKSVSKTILVEDDYKIYILNKTPKKGGKLEITYKIASGLTVETDTFSLFYTFDEKGVSSNGCASFFDLPSKMILKKSCVPTKAVFE